MTDVRVLTGEQILPHLDDLARLRIEVFAGFPYLYDGDPDYEKRYLQAYARSPDSVFVLAVDGDRVVGASTGLPLLDDTPRFRVPFIEQGIDPGRVFYFGESVLLPGYRGQGLGHRFFDAREAHAQALGRFDWTAFCSVQREPDDPRRPADHRDHTPFWSKRGYVPRPSMVCRLAWKEHGESGESEKPLMFWLRPVPE
jgi:GNAT superfamily N-acetyltransferase